jgi:flagellar M-ring protein FliF
MAEASVHTLPAPAPRAWPAISPQHIGLMFSAATLIAILVAGYLWSQAPDYRVLYGNLHDRDGGAVVAALQQMNVPYKFADGGALMVPSAQIHETRLRLAAQGLPKAGPAGFELMETQKFGVSQFAEQINYQRALEGELARTIQTLAPVQAARVHLALSKPSAFMREQPKASASVLLNLAAGRSLDNTQVSAVVHLVSNSVPELLAKNVSVVDQNGNLLSNNGNGDARKSLDPDQLKYRQSLEQNYIARIESILAPLIGAANVRAQVTAELDFTETEHAEEIHKPNQDAAAAAVRSQQLSESTSRAGGAAGGIPGALSNQPPANASAPINAPAAPAAAAPAAAAPADLRKDSTVNYEVDKTIRHTRQEVGRIKRLSVAVVVNHKKQTSKSGKVSYAPLAEAEIAQITSLVKEVMAFDKDRGDSLSVANSPFSVPDKEVLPETPLWKQTEVIESAKLIGKHLLIAGILLFLVLRVMRPMLKSFATAVSAPPAPLLAQDGGDGAAPRQIENQQQNIDRAKKIAREDPQVVANVVKEWVAGNGK